MAAPAPVLSRNNEVVKQREGERLRRFLRILFGFRSLNLYWTDYETSYFDGNDLYILHNMQTDRHRLFTEAEQRTLRKGHGIHEGGHKEYDVLADYVEWQQENQTSDFHEWKTNTKYPLEWLKFFGNVMMDGRMENLVTLSYPTTKPYLDFSNYEWRFGIREENVGEDKIQDFRTCFMSRALAMTDLEEWDEEAVALVDSIQPLIEKARFATSTKECLEITTDIIKEVWTILFDWLDLKENDVFDFEFVLIGISDHDESNTWGTSEETSENAEKTLQRAGIAIEEDLSSENKTSSEGENTDESEGVSGEGEDDKKETKENKENDSESTKEQSQKKEGPQKPDFSLVIKKEEKQMKEDISEAESDAADFEERKEKVEIEIPGQKKYQSDQVKIQPYPRNPNSSSYAKGLGDIKRYIKPTERILLDLLKGSPDKVRRNQRSGRVNPSRVWRAETVGEINFFNQKREGTPTKDAYIQVVGDLSGSTCCDFGKKGSVQDEMRRAMTLLFEACHNIKLPITGHSFTEYGRETILFPLKPNPYKYNEREKGTIGSLQPEAGNRDTLALQWGVDQLKKRNEDIRLLIMLSDGLPIFGPNENESTMTTIVKKAAKEGVEILCLFIGDHDSDTINSVRTMYPGRSIIVTNNLVRELQKHVKRIIRTKR